MNQAYRKPTYEELLFRFQNYCKHDGGRLYDGTNRNLCSICEWDLNQCQHKQERGNFCSQCGEKLKQD